MLQDSHFIHCIETNKEKQRNQFQKDLVSVQLDSIGVLPIFNLMHHGYGAKIAYQEISSKMSQYIPNNAKFHTNDMCRDIFISMQCSSNSFKLGQTHVFFRPKYEYVLDKFRAMDTDEAKKIGDNVSAIFKSRQRRALWFSIRFVGRGEIPNFFTPMLYFYSLKLN